MNVGPAAGAVLAADGVRLAFRQRRGSARDARDGSAGGRSREVVAVDGVSLSVRAGETLGLVGESGCGKSTLGRLMVGLETPDAGRVTLDGRPTSELARGEWREFRKRVQIVFQDPYASLNPRMTIGSALREALTVRGPARGGRDARVAALLELVELDPAAARRFPHEFSGGQRQRIGIARALAVEPEIVIADEPVSALDVSVQARILGLMGRLQRELGLGYLFISHDLAVIRQIATRVAVMVRGRVIETGPAELVLAEPRHEYTQALLAAVPRLRTPT